MINNSLLHITRNEKLGTVIDAVPGSLNLNLGQNLDKDQTKFIFFTINEILKDLKTKTFQGNFKFFDDELEITLQSNNEIKTWRKAVN